MPQWSSTPPTRNDGLSFRIVRTPASRAIAAIVTATDITGCCTHFAKNRTIPCEGPEICPWCNDGFSWRWHGYLPCVLTDTFEHVIFEFTAAAAETFNNYLTAFNSLRACKFIARRPSGRPNGRVVIACTHYDERKVRLPDPPDVRRMLCHIWNVKHNATNLYKLPDRLGNQIGVGPNPDDGRNRP